MQQWKKRGTYHSVLEAIQEMSGLTEEELLSPSHIEPNRIQNIPEAAECIRACAITQGMPVVIVGDYDADGITSTAILVKLLGHFGVRTKTIIPKRFTDGYGISESLIQGITNSLIITIDNGVSAIEPIRAAKAAGNTVIVLDHHLPQDTLPEADLIVDPHIFPEKNGYEHYCGAGLAYKLAEFLCASESSQQKKGLFFDLLVLACIGTLADVVPLTGDNRYLVIAGLQVINHKTWFYQLSSGIQAILNLADRPYDEDTIKFQIAPILNAAGRLYNAGSSSVLKALLSEDDTQSLVFASKMKQINEERKRLVTHWLTIAAAACESCHQQAGAKDQSQYFLQFHDVAPFGFKIYLYALDRHAFTAPIVMPVTKYFCTKGYTHRMGRVEITMAPYSTLRAYTVELDTSDAEVISLVDWNRIFRSSICRGYNSVLVGRYSRADI